jgi:hypothetical protein
MLFVPLISAASALLLGPVAPLGAHAVRPAVRAMPTMVEEHAASPTGAASEEVWYEGPACYRADSPSDDPTVTCFLAPESMASSGEGEWICKPKFDLDDSPDADDSF